MFLVLLNIAVRVNIVVIPIPTLPGTDSTGINIPIQANTYWDSSFSLLGKRTNRFVNDVEKTKNDMIVFKWSFFKKKKKMCLWSSLYKFYKICSMVQYNRFIYIQYVYGIVYIQSIYTRF